VLDRLAEHDARGLGIEPPVELGRGRDVARHLDGAPHVDDPPHQRHDLGVLAERQRQVGERPDGQDRHLPRVGLDRADQEVDSVHGLGLGVPREPVGRGREVLRPGRLRLAPAPRVALAEELLLQLERGPVVQERVERAGIDLDLVGHAHALDGAQRVRHLLVQPLVAADHGQPQDLDLGLPHGLHEHDEGLPVVAHGVEVGVVDHLLGGPGRPGRSTQQGHPERLAPTAAAASAFPSSPPRLLSGGR
jgi:hypothetical protein